MKTQFKKGGVFKHFGVKSDTGMTQHGLKSNQGGQNNFNNIHSKIIHPALQK